MRKLVSIALLFLLFLAACKKRDQVFILQEKYEPTVSLAEADGKDYEVALNARALQVGERGEWSIISGEFVKDFVYFENKDNPFSVFKGIPSEQYTLEWTHWDKNGKSTKIQTAVNIPSVKIEIKNTTPSSFSTIISLGVDPKYKGTWTFDKPFGRISSRYFDGYASDPNSKPLISLHGFQNTTYLATYSYVYAGKVYRFQKEIKTGAYNEIEGLSELDFKADNPRVLNSREGKVLELNLQASPVGARFNHPEIYPALHGLKNLRKLILGGSSLEQIADIFGESYQNLEVLDLDGVGGDLYFPENFGNLTKLKKLVVARLYANSVPNMVLPSSFANLKSLEYFSVNFVTGYIDFNGTLGKLVKLKYLSANMTSIPDNIGELKELHSLNTILRNSYIPESISNCTNLVSLRLSLSSNTNKRHELPVNIGKLKKLEELELRTSLLYNLPESFGDLSALTSLAIESVNLETVPENFGKLSNLESLRLYGVFTRLPNSFGNLHRLKALSLGGTLSYLPDSFGNLSALEFFEPYSQLKKLPENFGSLKNLITARFSRCKLEILPASFSDLDALTDVELSNNNLKTFPVSLIPLKNILNIQLSGNNVGDIPDEISKMKSGVVIGLRSVPNITRERIIYLKNITKGIVFDTDFGYF